MIWNEFVLLREKKEIIRSERCEAIAWHRRLDAGGNSQINALTVLIQKYGTTELTNQGPVLNPGGLK